MRSAQRNDSLATYARVPPSVARKVAAILAAYRADEPVLTMTEVARRAGLAKTTVHRLAQDLVADRLLERVEGGYCLGTRLFELGQLVPRSRTLRDTALPFLEDLYEATHQTVHLAVLDGVDVLYLEKISGHAKVRAPSRVAGRMPAYCTGVGKALLAFSTPDLVRRVVEGELIRRTPYTITAPKLLMEQLRAIRESGVAYEREESTLGLGCAAAPTFGPDHVVIAAISVAAPILRIEPSTMASAVRTAALGLSRAFARDSITYS